jgi:hypothetical protein
VAIAAVTRSAVATGRSAQTFMEPLRPRTSSSTQSMLATSASAVATRSGSIAARDR